MSDMTQPSSNGSSSPEAVAEALPTEVSVEDTLRIQLVTEKSGRLEAQRALMESQHQQCVAELEKVKAEAQKITTEIWSKYQLTQSDRFLTDTRKIERGVVAAPAAPKN